MALYVYGIMRRRDAARAASALRKDAVPDAGAVEHDDVSALVTALGEGEVRMRRENILAHADVLAAAFAHGPVLPVRLGTAMPDERTVVRELLAPREQDLIARLEALDGKAEMQVKAKYAEEPLLRSVLAADPALRRAVERNRNLPPAATHFDQIRIGEAIAAAVQARQVSDSDMLLGALRPLAVSVSVAPPHHERAVLNAGFLVQSGELPQFDAEVERLSQARAGEIEFKLIGPLPPYSFAGREWQPTGDTRSLG